MLEWAKLNELRNEDPHHLQTFVDKRRRIFEFEF